MSKGSSGLKDFRSGRPLNQAEQAAAKTEDRSDERRELAKAIYVELISKNRTDMLLEHWANVAWQAADAFLAREPGTEHVDRGPDVR